MDSKIISREFPIMKAFLVKKEEGSTLRISREITIIPRRAKEKANKK
tara:strand:+ start:548 stop:688 length:141 start_codon:yes stop_codon:yes gene_type:complete